MVIGRIAALVAALVVVVAACGDDTGLGTRDAWSRGGIEGQNAAVYLELESADGDTLVGVTVDSSIAAEAQLHETVMADMSDGDDTDDMSQGMTMQPISELPLPAGTRVTLEPGGLHIMLFDLAGPIDLDSTFQVTLQLETAGEVTLDVEVRDEAP